MSSRSAPAAAASAGPVTPAAVTRAWLPLAASWLLMAVELPLLTAVVGRLPDDRIHLGAYGSIVFPVSLVVEGPIIMLLAASTALCTHWRTYLQVRRFMMAAGAALTLVHAAIAFTPLYEVVARDIMGAPEAILEPGRVGLRIMLPWTWAIAYRRFQQGVLIRNDEGREVTLGTAVRLVTNAGMLGFGAFVMEWPGIVVGASAIAAGVTAEALWIGWRVRPVLARQVRTAPAEGDPLTVGCFLRFYVPLALTPLITLFIQPLGAMAMNRMPQAVASVAAWPAVHGMLFITRSLGMAYNEVVVTLADKPGAVAALRSFQRRLALGTMGFLALLAATPLAELWFVSVSELDREVANLCKVAIALGVLMPGYAVLQSWFQGVLVKRRTTRAVTEAVALYFAVSAVLLWTGVQLQRTAGVWWALGSFVTAGILQTAWLWWRSREAVRHFERADGGGGVASVGEGGEV